MGYRKAFATTAKIAVTVSLLSWLVLQFDLPQAAASFSSVHPGVWLLAFALAVLMTVLLALRWQLLLRAAQVRMPFKETCGILFIGGFIGDILPSGLGVEVVKVHYARSREGGPIGGVVLSVLVDRYLGLLALVSLPLIVPLARRPTDGLEGALATLYAGVLFLLMIAAALAFALNRRRRPPPGDEPPGKFYRLVRNLESSLGFYRNQKTTLMAAFGISAITQLLNIAVYYSFGAGLGEHRRLIDFFYIVPAITLAALLPVSLGGIGVREWTFVSLFTHIGMPLQTALSVSVLTLGVKIALSLIGAALYVAKRRPDHE